MDATQKPQETNSLPQKLPTQEITSKSPSPLSSPAHEFSFTITLHPSPSSSSPSSFKPNNKNSPSPSFALDLAPADDIFFHGHLLPLHLLSHSHISPRPSTDITIEDLYPCNKNIMCGDINNNTKEKKKPSSFSFRLSKWFEEKKKKVFDVKHLLKKYVSMVEPLFITKKNKGKRDLRRRPYSFSVSSNYKEREKWMLKRRDISAPASMRTSPTNSGLLVATPANLSSSDESSMEELQNAIQAAIAYCKDSTTTKERAV